LFEWVETTAMRAITRALKKRRRTEDY
jgi:hypothetical protein